jgi:hypothetical protein
VTPTPTPTPTPIGQLIDVLITDEVNTYIQVGMDEYLKYIDP